MSIRQIIGWVCLGAACTFFAGSAMTIGGPALISQKLGMLGLVCMIPAFVIFMIEVGD